MTTSGVTTLFGHNRTSPLWKRCGHISSCTEIARRQRTTWGRRGEGGWRADMACVCPQQRHKCFTNAAQTLRQELIKKKCSQHEKQLKKLFLHNNNTCQNCSLEKYFAIFGCEFLHKMSATSKTFRRCLFFFALGSRLVVSPRTPWAKANATDPPLQRGSWTGKKS